MDYVLEMKKDITNETVLWTKKLSFLHIHLHILFIYLCIFEEEQKEQLITHGIKMTFPSTPKGHQQCWILKSHKETPITGTKTKTGRSNIMPFYMDKPLENSGFQIICNRETQEFQLNFWEDCVTLLLNRLLAYVFFFQILSSLLFWLLAPFDSFSSCVSHLPQLYFVAFLMFLYLWSLTVMYHFIPFCFSIYSSVKLPVHPLSHCKDWLSSESVSLGFRAKHQRCFQVPRTVQRRWGPTLSLQSQERICINFRETIQILVVQK